MEICRLELNKPIDNIMSALEEIERYKIELISGTNPLLQAQQNIQLMHVSSSNTGLSKADIEKIVKSLLHKNNHLHAHNYLRLMCKL